MVLGNFFNSLTPEQADEVQAWLLERDEEVADTPMFKVWRAYTAQRNLAEPEHD